MIPKQTSSRNSSKLVNYIFVTNHFTRTYLVLCVSGDCDDRVTGQLYDITEQTLPDRKADDY